ncbi:MAG: hypothetical protein HQL09_01180 [Nitrospirae bacterium]|nr:hypothetical protein [Nitrospirota bacterium]
MNTCMVHSNTVYTVVGDEHNCPYCNNEAGICAASLSRLVIDANRRTGHCDSENYDNCPIFLARTLRKR